MSLRAIAVMSSTERAEVPLVGGMTWLDEIVPGTGPAAAPGLLLAAMRTRPPAARLGTWDCAA
jgi:hypothetical protein